MNSVGTSYILWFVWIFGLAGLHRLYNRQVITGLIWFFTWGLFGFGQLIDLVLIPGMVEQHNLRARARLGTMSGRVPLYVPATNVEMLVQGQYLVQPSQAQEQIILKLLQVIKARGGTLSIAQGSLDTGCSFKEVETALERMVDLGYITAEREQTSGVVVYSEIKLTQEQLMIKLLRAAHNRGGKISVTQGVLDTGCGFTEVEATLKEMVRTGYVAVSNDPQTGVVIYDFIEL
jgi:predicted transcriptional regulator